jgi:hypothetical protein
MKERSIRSIWALSLLSATYVVAAQDTALIQQARDNQTANDRLAKTDVKSIIVARQSFSGLDHGPRATITPYVAKQRQQAAEIAQERHAADDVPRDQPAPGTALGNGSN